MFFTKPFIKLEVNEHTHVYLKKLRKHLLLCELKANNDLLVKDFNFAGLPATNLQELDLPYIQKSDHGSLSCGTQHNIPRTFFLLKEQSKAIPVQAIGAPGG
jgi:hypothetical protein